MQRLQNLIHIFLHVNILKYNFAKLINVQDLVYFESIISLWANCNFSFLFIGSISISSIIYQTEQFPPTCIEKLQITPKVYFSVIHVNSSDKFTKLPSLSY